MKIIPQHDKLNLFKVFGGDCANENNFTRAFLIALSKSPWSPVLLRGFLDLLASKLTAAPGTSHWEFLSRWPETVELWMQQGVAKSEFLGNGVRCALLVELTPAQERVEGDHQSVQSPEAIAGGIVDAVVILRTRIATNDTMAVANDAMAVVLESKLYGPVGGAQIAQYREAMTQRLGEGGFAHLSISWDEVYGLTEALPPEAEFDPILSDFKAFIASRPHLVRFTGFAASDFNDWSVLDGRVRRLAERLAGDASLDTTGDDRLLLDGQPEKKRGDCDYDLPMRERQSLRGNIGVACWDQKRISTKLVIGARTFQETEHVLAMKWTTKEVGDLLARICQEGHTTISADVRLFFRYRDEALLRIATEQPQPGRETDAWSSVISAAKRFNRKPGDDALLDELSKEAREDPRNDIERARVLPIEKRPSCFAVIAVISDWDGRELVKMRPDEQVAKIRRSLAELGRLLVLLSR